MSNPNMLAIQLSNSNITGENLQLEPGVTLDLEVGVYKVLHFLPLPHTISFFSIHLGTFQEKRQKGKKMREKKRKKRKEGRKKTKGLAN